MRAPGPMLPAVLAIDVEPDARTPDPRDPRDWLGFEAMLPRIDEVRDQLGTICWFVRLDPQVAEVHGSPAWPLKRYESQFKALIRSGDAIGLHTHPYRRENDTWVEDFTDSGWIRQSMEMGFRAYRDSLGRGCENFRFGGRWTSTATMRAAAKLGARFDLTVEPGPLAWGPAEPEIRWRFPDCSAAPRVPYRPSRFDFRRRGTIDALDLWALPVTTAPAVARRPIPRSNGAGRISIDPALAVVGEPWERTAVDVSWSVPGERQVEVRIDDPDGALFAGGGSEGSARTGRWVSHGMQFFLRDLSTGDVLASAAAQLTLREDKRPLRDRALRPRLPARALEQWIDLNLAFDAREFEDALRRCVADPQTRHLVVVCRSDAALEPQATDLRANLRLLTRLAREGGVRFVDPATAVRMASG